MTYNCVIHFLKINMNILLRNKTSGFALVIFLFLSISSKSQLKSRDTTSIFIRNILIEGNKKTKSHIILREIPFKRNDTLDRVRAKELMLNARKNIYNTELFISVDVYDVKIHEGVYDIYVFVKERWYTLPIPYLELADRSFNVWLQKYHADLRRLSYGVDFIQQNLTGRNDKMEVLATAGFNRQLQVDYTTPYLSQAMKSRLKLGFGIMGSKEIPYISTDSNKLLYHQSDVTIRRGWHATTGFIIRREIKKREWITVSLNGANIFDSINYYNPDYFKGNATHHVFPEVEYKMKYDDVDNIMYPLKGKKYQLILSKRGLGWSGDVNRLFAAAYANFFQPFGKDWFGAFKLRGQIMVPFDQPFYNTKAIGYGDDYIRGYEFYVIDGIASFIAKADIKKKLIFFEVPTFLNSKNYSKIPFTLYGKVYTDIGAAYNRNQSMLGNQLQYGGGIGLDIVTLYDLSLSLNFSVNALGQKGFYLHRE